MIKYAGAITALMTMFATICMAQGIEPATRPSPCQACDQSTGTTMTSGPPIRKFLTNFEQVTNAYGHGIQARMSEPGTRMLAEHFTSVLNVETSRLSAFVRESYERASPAQRQEIDQLLTRQAAVELTAVPQAMYLNLNNQASFKGVSDIIGLAKKIIKVVVGLFGDPPSWLNDLLELIDEIVGASGGLFSPQLQRDINQTEIDYLQSMFFLQKLNMLEQTTQR